MGGRPIAVSIIARPPVLRSVLVAALIVDVGYSTAGDFDSLTGSFDDVIARLQRGIYGGKGAAYCETTLPNRTMGVRCRRIFRIEFDLSSYERVRRAKHEGSYVATYVEDNTAVPTRWHLVFGHGFHTGAGTL